MRLNLKENLFDRLNPIEMEVVKNRKKEAWQTP